VTRIEALFSTPGSRRWGLLGRAHEDQPVYPPVAKYLQYQMTVKLTSANPYLRDPVVRESMVIKGHDF
jgi:hypothetical protein